MDRLALFASGNGSNVQRITEYFSGHPAIHVELILTNNPEAFVINRARALHVPIVVFSRDQFYHSGYIPNLLSERKITHLILAGFLWMVPSHILNLYRSKILNIHPALLPKYGGKGMYGMRVHQAVIASGDAQSGITIHQVNEKYDEGQVVFQARCEVTREETPETLAEKVHQLEYRYYPEVIEKELLGRGA